MSAADGRPLAYVLERYPELSQTFVEGEMRELAALGANAIALALRPGSGAPGATPVDYPADHGPAERLTAAVGVAATRPRAAGHLVAREPFWPPDGRRARGLARLAPWVASARRARHMHAHFAAEAADIARLLSALSGTPFSFVAHATDAFRDPDALRANMAGARFCVASAGYVRDRLLEVAPEHAHKVEQLMAGPDLERFRRSRPYDPDGPVVCVARLIPKKGIDDLVRAMATLAAGSGTREAIVVGDGPERPRLERLIAETGAPVRLLGALPHEQVRALIEDASLFALACVVAPDGDRDGIPVALMEAMALELPIAGTKEGGLPELVGPDRGRLAPPRDPRALAALIEELLALEPARREAMGRAGRAWVAGNADPARQARRLLELIEGARPGQPGRA